MSSVESLGQSCQECDLIFDSKSAKDTHLKNYCPFKVTLQTSVKAIESQSLSRQLAFDTFKQSFEERFESQAPILYKNLELEFQLENARKVAQSRIDELELQKRVVEHALEELEKHEQESRQVLVAIPKELTLSGELADIKQLYLSGGGNDSQLISQMETLNHEARELESTSIHFPQEDPHLKHQRFLLDAKLERERLLISNEMNALKKALYIPNPDEKRTTTTISQSQKPVKNSSSLPSPIMANDTQPVMENNFIVPFDYHQVKNSNYDSQSGILLILDFFLGMPEYFNASDMTVVATVFDGMQSSLLFSNWTIGPIPIVSKKLKTTSVLAGPIHTKLELHNLPINKNLRLLIECKFSQSEHKSLWTIYDFFNEKALPDVGRWRMPMYPPPIDYKNMTSNLHIDLKPIRNVFICFRSVETVNSIQAKSETVSIPDDFALYITKHYKTVSGIQYDLPSLKQKESQPKQGIPSARNVEPSQFATKRSLQDWLGELLPQTQNQTDRVVPLQIIEEPPVLAEMDSHITVSYLTLKVAWEYTLKRFGI